jgi:hypothetical protein
MKTTELKGRIKKLGGPKESSTRLYKLCHGNFKILFTVAASGHSMAFPYICPAQM